MNSRVMFPPLLYSLSLLIALGVAAVTGTLSPAVAAACDAPAAVCDWQDRIVGIKTPNMIASGTVLPGGYIVTNHHVAEDHAQVITRDAGGVITRATPQPHDVDVDLVLLRVQGAEVTPPVPEQVTLSAGRQQLFVVAFDQGRNGPRVYRPGDWAQYPKDGASTRARIHTNANALPGNSGGAVVDAEGALVGILASGDGKISEVIPAVHIFATADRMSASHAVPFSRVGRAIRECADALYDSASIQRDPPADLVSVIETRCLESGNKQLLDQAGQSFGRWWMFAQSRSFLERSLDLDPDSPNSLMSLAVTLHLDRDLAGELPLLKRYLAIDPTNAQALRMAVQVAGGVGDREFGEQALDLMRRHNPAAVPLAESFLKQAFGD
ncbi:trypsin-like peptidase domain-containing protein [Alphaproteobacteria bacterium LSUCC0719]